MTLFSVEEREEIAERVSRLLGNDDRIEGVVIVGSLAGQSDRWSDIDIEVIVADDEELSAVAANWVGNLYELLPVVHHFEKVFGDTLVRGFLLENLLEVDLAFDQARSLSIWGPAKVMFDRTGRVADAANAHAQDDPYASDLAGEAGFAWHTHSTPVNKGYYSVSWPLEFLSGRNHRDT